MPDVTVIENAFTPRELDRIHHLRHGFPVYAPSAVIPAGFQVPRRFRYPPGRRLRFAPGIPARADVGRYQARLSTQIEATTGRKPVLTAYLRATYAAHGKPCVTGAEEMLGNPRLAQLARELFGCRNVFPTTIFANLYLPGQWLPGHTDIPAFRGAERGQVPGWLLVAMHHSRRFERWRIPVATVVAYPRPSKGGDFFYFPPAPEGSRTHDAQNPTIHNSPNSALLLDADTVFHGVTVVEGDSEVAAGLQKDDYLVPDAGRWLLRRGDPTGEPVAVFGDDEIRYSISWKAYCFQDVASRRAWAQHSDDLALDEIIPVLTDELAARGALPAGALNEERLADAIIENLIPFPEPGS